MKLNRLTSLLLTLSLSLWMVGCGVSYRAATESKTPTVDKIQQRGTLLVGTTGDYRPLSADVQNPALFDLAIGGITVTDARKETMDMSEGYLDKPFTHSKIGILMRKGQEDLLELVNATLREMKADGSLKALREKYGLQQNTIMDARELLEGLKGREVVLFVADQDELSPSEVPFPVVFTGMGKMRMFSALVTWYENRTDKSKPVILNIGSAGSAKYPIGTIVNCTHFINGGSELVYDCTDIPGDGCSVFSGDYFMSTQTFSPEQVKELSQKYDIFDMEAYAAAQFCKMHNLEFHCLKAVSDNLDGNLKDWRSILADIRVQFTELLKSCAQ